MVWGAEITRYTGRGRQRSATPDDGSVVLLIRLAPQLQVPPLDEPTILLTWYDCSADEPEDYSATRLRSPSLRVGVHGTSCSLAVHRVS